MISFESVKTSFLKIKNNPSFTLKEQLGFASGLFGNCMGQDTVGTYTDQFLCDYMGIKTSTVGVLKATATGVSMASTPLVGLLLDRPHGKRGGAKSFLFASALPLTISSILLFVVPNGSLNFRIIWSFLFFLLFTIADTFYDMSILTVSTRMTKNPKDRKNFYTVAEFASTLGSMLPGWVLPLIVGSQNGYQSERSAYFMIALSFGILGLITMWIPCFTLQEKIFIPVNQKKKVDINLKAIMCNRPLMLLCLAQIVESIRQVCYNALPFFYKQTLGNYSLKAIVDAISGGLSYIGLAAVPALGRKLSPKTMYVGAYVFTGAIYILFALLGYKHLWIVGAMIGIGGFPNGAARAARKIMLADSTDYMEWKTFKKYGTPIRSDGMVFAANSLSNKIASLWRNLLINVGLSIIGYKSATVVNGKSVEAIQTPQTLHGIFLLVVIPGIIGNLLPALIMAFDNFTGKKREAIMAELEVIRAEMTEQIKEMEMAEIE